MKHMLFSIQNWDLFHIVIQKMKGLSLLLFLCMIKSEVISNVATQKRCEQTVMDDEMKYCADRKYSLRISFVLEQVTYNKD